MSNMRTFPPSTKSILMYINNSKYWRISVTPKRCPNCCDIFPIICFVSPTHISARPSISDVLLNIGYWIIVKSLKSNVQSNTLNYFQTASSILWKWEKKNSRNSAAPVKSPRIQLEEFLSLQKSVRRRHVESLRYRTISSLLCHCVR